MHADEVLRNRRPFIRLGSVQRDSYDTVARFLAGTGGELVEDLLEYILHGHQELELNIQLALVHPALFHLLQHLAELLLHGPLKQLLVSILRGRGFILEKRAVGALLCALRWCWNVLNSIC